MCVITTFVCIKGNERITDWDTHCIQLTSVQIGTKIDFWKRFFSFFFVGRDQENFCVNQNYEYFRIWKIMNIFGFQNYELWIYFWGREREWIMKTRMERVVSSIMFFVSPFHLYPLSMSVIIINTLLLNERRRFLECLIWTKIIWIDFWFKSNWMNLIQKKMKMMDEKRRDKKIGPKVQARKWMMISTTIKESNWLLYILYICIVYIYYMYTIYTITTIWFEFESMHNNGKTWNKKSWTNKYS